MLLYGLEACPVNRAQINSLEFIIVRCFMKIFATGSKNVARDCMEAFDFQPVENTIETRKKKFVRRYIGGGKLNSVCCAFAYGK